MDFIWIAIGGAIGSVGRYAVARGVHTWLPATWPYGTLVVNVLGCALIGLLAGTADSRGAVGPTARAFLLIGVLGGFTTFSSFAYETLQLSRDAQLAPAVTNVLANVGLSLAAAWLAYHAGRLL